MRFMSQKSSKTKLYAVLVIIVLEVAATAGYYYQVSQKTSAKTVAVFYYFTDFPNLDPTIAFENQQIVLANVYEDLVYFDPNSTQPLQPWLATSWNTSADGLTWTFHLRTGITFHDGTPFTAEAVKFSIERAKHSVWGQPTSGSRSANQRNRREYNRISTEILSATRPDRHPHTELGS